MHRAIAFAIVMIVLGGRAACAATGAGDPSRTGVATRVGVHDGFQRLVFDLPDGDTGLMTQDGATVTLRFTSAGVPGVPVPMPSNVLGIQAANGTVVLTLAARVRVRQIRLRDRIVLDLLDPPTTAQVATSGVTATAPRGVMARLLSQAARSEIEATNGSGILPSRPETVPSSIWASRLAIGSNATPRPSSRSLPNFGVGSPDRVTDPPAFSAVVPVSAAPIPGPGSGVFAPQSQTLAQAADRTVPLDLMASGEERIGAATASDVRRVLRLPFSAQAGAAAFRLGDELMLVFDERRPIDTARLRQDPAFASVTVQLLADGTLVHVLLPPGGTVRLQRTPGAWEIGLHDAGDEAPRTADPIRSTTTPGAFHLAAAAPGRVVAVPNSLTGGVLLVGTQTAPGQGVAVARRNPILTLLPTWQGVVVEPAGDALVMRAEKAGFVITGDSPARPLAVADGDAETAAMADAGALTRRFDLPALPVFALLRRLRQATAEAAEVPLQSRAGKRLQVAQAMLSLGLGQELQSLMGLTASDDPQSASNPDVIALSAISALLAGRPNEADGLDDARLTGSDEIAFWRAIRGVMRAEIPNALRDGTQGAAAPAAAPVLAANVKLLLSYPEPLRAQLLPLAAEVLATSGEDAAAASLLATRPDDPALRLARGMFAEHAALGHGDPEPALAMYDALAVGRDRLTRWRAAVAAIELRLTRGKLTPNQAADALERLFFAWRGDDRELAIRLRAAALRGTAGEWRRGLAILREAAQDWPDKQAPIRRRLVEMFEAALSTDADTQIPALELVSLAEENVDLVPDGEPGRQLASRLADRLVKLDLPARAIATLGHMLADTSPGAAYNELAMRLAALQLQDHDATGAEATLSTLNSETLQGELADSRDLLLARVAAARGDLPSALAKLDQLGSAAAEDVRADILEAAKDWAGTTSALLRRAERDLPQDGILDGAQSRLLIRLASAAAQAGDEGVLARLRETMSARMPNSEMTNLFGVLTEPPIRNASDLPRAAREVTLARGLPEAVRSYPTSAVRPMAAR